MAIILFEFNGHCCAGELSYIVIFFHCYVDKPAMLLRQKQFKAWQWRASR